MWPLACKADSRLPVPGGDAENVISGVDFAGT